MNDIKLISDIIRENIIDGKICGIIIDRFNVIDYENNGKCIIYEDHKSYENTMIDNYAYHPYQQNLIKINVRYDLKSSNITNDTYKPYIEYNTTRLLYYMINKNNISSLKNLMIILINLTSDSYSRGMLSKTLRMSNVHVYLSYYNMRYLLCSLTNCLNSICRIPSAKGAHNYVFFTLEHNIDIMSFMLFIQIQRIKHMDTIKGTVTFLLSLIESVKI